jgi:tRNA (guanine37-N1)-methyltransferase
MKFHFLTIFPDIIKAYIGESILKRASEKKTVFFDIKHVRDYTKDKHKKTDDRPYGGGPGMVMTPEPMLRAHAKLKFKGKKVKVIMLTPSGQVFTNALAAKYAKQYSDIVFLCGRYEGIDDRVRKILKADEVSIGSYTVTGGELPALAMTDAICRQIPGVLGKGESVEESRIASPRVYTRPETLVWKDKKYKVPKVLLQGDHKKIDAWRKTQQKGTIDNI